jgi:uncharacterized protein
LGASVKRSLQLAPLEPAGSGAALPAGPSHLRFASGRGMHVLVVDGSRIYDLPPELDAELARLEESGDAGALDAMLATWGLTGDLPPRVDDEPLAPPPVRSASLAVAQACNLGCSYCYADGGSFGAKPASMPWHVARATVDRLFEGARPGERVQIAFLGGEPLLQRGLIHDAVAYAHGLSVQRGVPVSYGLTTNGTLLNDADAAFFAEHGFAVTISVDGIGDVHDRQRPMRDGRGSFELLLKRAAPLLGRLAVSARVTVTPANLDLTETLDGLLKLGFASVGFSPTLATPNRQGALRDEDFATLLEQLIACGRRFEAETLAGRRYGFGNLVTALREIHRGTHRPYPCGAGAGYVGVAADGRASVCHRFVGSRHGQLGSVLDGLDVAAQGRWLTERHVHRQEPCRACWARYLCGGSCHHEALARGRPACGYIRGWLEYALGAYVRLSDTAPEYFAAAAPVGGLGGG